MTTKPDSVAIEMMLPASIRDVWKAWTDPELVLHWFGSDPNGKGIMAKLDVRPAGKYEITFQDSDGTAHTCYGCYQEIMKWNKLTFTWAWKSEPTVESLVTIVLTPQDDGTRMQFEHAHIGTASIHNYSSGWKGAFSKLQYLLHSAR